MLGSGIGGLDHAGNAAHRLVNKGSRRVSPFMIPMMISNMASGLVSMEYGLQGPNICHVSACATANNAIGEAWRVIKFGDADLVPGRRQRGERVSGWASRASTP